VTPATTGQPPSVAQWLNAMYCHPARPSALQRDVLTALAVKFLNWKTGAGRASIEMLSEFCNAGRSTVQRALKWGQKALMITRTRRGHRVWHGDPVASEWQLTLPIQQVNDLSVVQPHTTGQVSAVA
jgi:hypothetical protein